MAAQQIEAPSRRRTSLIAVAFLVVALALAVGLVTAVNLFPATASGQAADEWGSLIEFRAGERAGLTQAGDEWKSLIEFRAGERAGLTKAADQTMYGPPGR